jgi:hypothetical protein
VGQLTRPVGAEVEVDDDVPVTHVAVGAVDHGRPHELVVLSPRVPGLEGVLG